MTDWVLIHLPETVIAATLALSTLVEVSPIRVNPWSWLARSIGRAINKDLHGTVSDLKDTIDVHVKMDDERYVKQCRMRILRFNDEILQGMGHSKEHYDEILDDITEYERYCRTHEDYRNSKATMSIHNIEKAYQECLKEKKFI